MDDRNGPLWRKLFSLQRRASARRLVAGTLQVYPMRGYGAVETGGHRFYQPQAGEEPTGEAKFIHLWQNKDRAWKITRVISYDHVGLPR